MKKNATPLSALPPHSTKKILPSFHVPHESDEIAFSMSFATELSEILHDDSGDDISADGSTGSHYKPMAGVRITAEAASAAASRAKSTTNSTTNPKTISKKASPKAATAQGSRAQGSRAQGSRAQGSRAQGSTASAAVFAKGSNISNTSNTSGGSKGANGSKGVNGSKGANGASSGAGANGSNDGTSEDSIELPILPVRDAILFPNVLLPVLVGREQSLLAVTEAMRTEEKYIFVTAQHESVAGDPSIEPSIDNIYRSGTIARVVQTVKLQGNLVKVLLDGVAQAQVRSFVSRGNPPQPYLRADLEILPEHSANAPLTSELEALIRATQKLFPEYLKLARDIASDVATRFAALPPNPSWILYFVAAQLRVRIGSKQAVLDAHPITEQFRVLVRLLTHEVEVLKMGLSLGTKVQDAMLKNQKRYIILEHIRALQAELDGDGDDDILNYTPEQGEIYAKIMQMNMLEAAEKKAFEELDKLRRSSPSSQDHAVIRTYIDTLLALPWNNAKHFTQDNLSLDNARAVLDEDHYGLDKVKDRIVEFIAVLNFLEAERLELCLKRDQLEDVLFELTPLYGHYKRTQTMATFPAGFPVDKRPFIRLGILPQHYAMYSGYTTSEDLREAYLANFYEHHAEHLPDAPAPRKGQPRKGQTRKGQTTRKQFTTRMLIEAIIEGGLTTAASAHCKLPREMCITMKGQVLCLVGPPGVGKTSLAKSIASALGRKFVRIALGGVRDEAEIRGHRRTYVGAMPGRIIQAMKRAGTSNPVILLDEVDKLGSDMRGDPASALLEVLDPEQNHAFNDHFLELDYDLSRVLFICTANVKYDIPAPLLDRMEVIELSSYLEFEKAQIAKRHLVAKQLERHGLAGFAVRFTDEAISLLINGYTKEAGVRNLERQIAAIIRKIAHTLVGEMHAAEKALINSHGEDFDAFQHRQSREIFLPEDCMMEDERLRYKSRMAGKASAKRTKHVIDTDAVRRLLKAPPYSRAMHPSTGDSTSDSTGDNIDDNTGDSDNKNNKNKKKSIRKTLPQHTPDSVGMATGLAWTSTGGDTLPVEVVIMPVIMPTTPAESGSHGKLTLTGKLGDVMKESALAALSYVRANTGALGMDASFAREREVHIHVPEGAIAKDGPSAGLTIAVAFISAATQKPVRGDVAMTGEVTLRGNVLPIGGLSEKILAAKSAGKTTVIIPKGNLSNLEDLPPAVTKGVKVVAVENISEALRYVFR
jgi:ATP-dependent Lon protease